MENAKFITVTYKDNMVDTKRFDKNLGLFIKNFNRKNNCNKNIKVCIPQLRGAYHAHIIFIWDSKAPFIPHEEIKAIWPHGNFDVRKINGKADDLGAYLASHLYDLPLEEVEKYNIPYDKRDVKEVTIDSKTRYFVKNAISSLIPTGFKILRPSRNLKKPTKEKKEYHEARKEVEYNDPTSSQAYGFYNTNGNQYNRIVHLEFNLVRETNNSGPTLKDLEAIKLLEKLKAEELEILKSCENLFESDSN